MSHVLHLIAIGMELAIPVKNVPKKVGNPAAIVPLDLESVVFLKSQALLQE